MIQTLPSHKASYFSQEIPAELSVESRTFESLPYLLRLHYPEQAYFFAALSTDTNSEKARDILSNILKRTSICKSNSLFHDEWLLVRKYVASIEGRGRDVGDTSYLTNIPSVQARLGELVTEAHPFRFLNELNSLSRFCLREFLMAEKANNTFENDGTYITQEDASDYALREMEVYIPLVRQMIDFK